MVDALQTQAFRDFSQALPTSREETAEETALAQLLQPCPPGFRATAEPIEDGGHFTRDRRPALAE
ncbi:MAG: hypothetical protein ACLQIB_05240 [Isosphaeraceae bacterium]